MEKQIEKRKEKVMKKRLRKKQLHMSKFPPSPVRRKKYLGETTEEFLKDLRMDKNFRRKADKFIDFLPNFVKEANRISKIKARYLNIFLRKFSSLLKGVEKKKKSKKGELSGK